MMVMMMMMLMMLLVMIMTMIIIINIGITSNLLRAAKVNHVDESEARVSRS